MRYKLIGFMEAHVRLNVGLVVAHVGALGALESLPVGEAVLGQVVFANEGLGADVASEISLTVRGLVLPQCAQFREAF